MANKVVPTQKQVSNNATSAVKGGVVGGLAKAVGRNNFGPLGGAVATVLAGASVGGTEGKVMSINATMDLVDAMMGSGFGTFQGFGQNQQNQGAPTPL